MAAPLSRWPERRPKRPEPPRTAAPIRLVLDLLRPRPWLRKLLMAGPIGLWLLLFQGIPLGLILLISFGGRKGAGAVSYNTFTVDNYVRFADPLYVSILLKSFAVALAVTLLTLFIGYPLAYFIASQPPASRNRWLFLVIVPFWTSMLIRTYGWMILLRSNGLINTLLLKLGLEHPLNLLYTEGAAMLGLVYMLLPFMVLPIYTSVEKLDLSLIRAAYDLGARPARTFRTVILPLTMPGVAAGSVLVMVPAMGLFYVADLLGGAKTVLIGNLIQRQFTQANDWPFGSAASVILSVLTLVLIFLYIRSGGKEEDLL